METITADEIKTLRLKMGLTGAQFAERIGVHRITVIRWEKGDVPTSGMALKALLRLKRRYL